MYNSYKKIELCYVWISSEESRLIHNQGFTFTNKYIFICEQDITQKKNFKITIKKNDKYIENFFCNNENGNKHTNIENISLIVGENGSGKSTLLNYLHNKLLDLYDTENIVILRSANVFIVLYFENSPVVEVLDESSGHEVKYYSYDKIYGERNGKKVFKDEFGGIKVITYSNIFNNSAIHGDSTGHIYPKIRNISTSSLIKKIHNDKKYNNRKLTQMEKLVQYDMLIMMEFIKRNMNSNDKIIHPPIKYLIIKSENFYEENVEVKSRFITDLPIFNDNNLLEVGIDKENQIILKEFKRLRNQWFDNMLNNNDISCFEKNSLMNIAYDIFNSFKDITSYEIYNKLNKFLKLEKDNLADDIINMLTFINKNNIKLENSPMYIELINQLENMRQNKIFRYYEDNAIVELNENSLNELSRFIELYWGTLNNPYYKFLWGNYNERKENNVRYLSSGENSMLLMYSRLYSVINQNFTTRNVQQDNEDDNTLLILMDEPELYLHPEWQRNLINRLITFFNNYFSEYNVQLIISSNTPFLITDVPKENLIVLNKKHAEDGDYYVVVENKEFKETFGQNIHTLLTEYFIDSTIGEFAKQKISKIIKFLNSEEFNEDIDQINIEKEIKMIGEPIIKNKLLEMFNAKFNRNPDNDIEFINRKIKELEEEKRRLEKKRENNND